MTDLALCIACGVEEPAPVLCHTCTERARRSLAMILDLRQMLEDWPEIDPGTPCLDQPHRLALVDNPVLTASGGPNLTVIAATDIRTRRIPKDGGWDPDDVVNIDGEILNEARIIAHARGLHAMPASITECLHVIHDSFEWSIRTTRVDEFVAVLESCANGLRALMRDLPEPPLGRCTQPDPKGERDMCGGPLRWRTDTTMAWSSTGDDLAVTDLVCGRCSGIWTQDDIELFCRTEPVDVWESVPRIAYMLGIPERTLRRWVSDGRLHRDGFGRVHHAAVWRILEEKKVAPSRANN